MAADFSIESLRKNHLRDQFDCGDDSLNQYLKQYARQSDGTGLAKTYVAVSRPSAVVLGCYTLTSGSVSFDTVPEKLPRYPVPVIHLARLAVDLSSQGEGLGELLLANALRKAVSIADEVGVYAVELYSKTLKAKRFYLKYGFTALTDDELHLYLPIKAIQIPEAY